MYVYLLQNSRNNQYHYWRTKYNVPYFIFQVQRQNNQTALLIFCIKHTTLQPQDVMYKVPSVVQNAEEIL